MIRNFSKLLTVEQIKPKTKVKKAAILSNLILPKYRSESGPAIRLPTVYPMYRAVPKKPFCQVESHHSVSKISARSEMTMSSAPSEKDMKAVEIKVW